MIGRGRGRGKRRTDDHLQRPGFLHKPQRFTYPFSMASFQLRDHGLVGIRFPYSKERVDAIKCIEERKWNKDTQEWEVPVSEAKRAAEVLQEDWSSVPKSVRDAYEETVGGKILLAVDNTFTRIRGHDLPMEAIEDAT